jgi:citrate lyase subunit beta / citryl-CoA lyase
MAAERSFLVVPRDRPERFGKGLSSGADGVIIALADAVAPDAKVVLQAEKILASAVV